MMTVADVLELALKKTLCTTTSNSDFILTFDAVGELLAEDPKYGDPARRWDVKDAVKCFNSGIWFVVPLPEKYTNKDFILNIKGKYVL